MKVYYYNDEKQPVVVQVNGQLRPSPMNPRGMPSIDYTTLKPQEGKLFDIDAPEGAIPWIKRWETRAVLLSYVQPEELPVASQPALSKSTSGEHEEV